MCFVDCSVPSMHFASKAPDATGIVLFSDARSQTPWLMLNAQIRGSVHVTLVSMSWCVCCEFSREFAECCSNITAHPKSHRKIALNGVPMHCAGKRSIQNRIVKKLTRRHLAETLNGFWWTTRACNTLPQKARTTTTLPTPRAGASASMRPLQEFWTTSVTLARCEIEYSMPKDFCIGAAVVFE